MLNGGRRCGRPGIYSSSGALRSTTGQQPLKVATILGTKGGIGKTTLGVNLGAALADMGQRVLLIDADPQGSLTKYYPLRYAALWRDEALRVLSDAAVKQHAGRAEFRQLLQTAWTGRAEPDAAGYRLARAYMNSLYQQLFGEVDAKLAELPGKPDFHLASSRWPAVILRLLKERPASGWLPPGMTWEDIELAAVDLAIEQLGSEGQPLRDATWGKLNAAAIAHPQADASPGLRYWLAAPPTPLPGDDHMPRLSTPDFG